MEVPSTPARRSHFFLAASPGALQNQDFLPARVAGQRRLEREESYDDAAVTDAGLCKVTVFNDRYVNGEWRVEHFDDDGGGCYLTVFAGPEAERRARACFAALKGRQLRTIRASTVSH